MTTTTTAILDKLYAVRAITKEQAEQALALHKARGSPIEEALIEIGALNEEGLLKQLAQIYRTRYVTTDKLRRAEIPPDIIQLIPVELATRLLVFPILLDQKLDELSIVTVNPLDATIEQEVAKASGKPRVRAFVSRPAAIKAAIAKFYRGDIHAFSAMDKASIQAFHNMMDFYERQLLDGESMAASLANAGGRVERMLSPEDMEQSAKRTQPQKAAPEETSLKPLVELARIMVSLIESGRGELAGHSAQTGYFTERMCRRIGLSVREVESITLAALLHDLGKGTPYHLTPFNVAEWDGHRIAALKRFETPLRIFQSLELPEVTLLSLKHMYERCDGQGLPDGLAGADIPLGARILALADTHADLTENPRNPFRRQLSMDEAIEILKKSKGKIFDPNLTELFSTVVAGDDIERQILSGAQTVLLVDADPEQCAIFDLQLTSHGFRVRTARTTDAALKALKDITPSIIVSEVDLEPLDGFKFKERLNADKSARQIPFVFFSTRVASADVEKGFSLGAADYLVKPSTIDVLVAKIKKYLSDRPGQTAAGVAGSLHEMSLPDLVQILSHGRKNGQLKLNMGGHRGEIHFMNGEIYNALFDNLQGEEAFFEMLRHNDGTFVLDPDFRTTTRLIEMTSETLLLEGMRRYDEDKR